MEPDKRIDDIIAMLDGSMQKGVGHVNVDIDELRESSRTIETGCADCNNPNHPTACSVPTLHCGLEDDEEGV